MRFLIVILCLAICTGCNNQGIFAQTYSGTLEITEHKLGFNVAGKVATLSVEEGDMVKAGQVIATLDRYEQAKKDYERLLQTYQDGGATQQALEHAKLAMEDQLVTSPVDGVVLIKVHEKGEVIAAGLPVVVIGETKDKWVTVYVPQGLVSQVFVEQIATITFDGLDKEYSGHVRTIATKAEFTPRNVQTKEERVTQSFAVKVAIDEAVVDAHPGVTADVRFEKGLPPCKA